MSLPRPEETAQAVFFSPRNNVYVQVRHALAHPVVNREKRAVRLHALFDGARQHLDIAEERRNELRGKILERFIVRLRNQQRVAREKRTVVQERHGYVVFKNDIAFQITRDDLAELASLRFVAQGFPATISDTISAGCELAQPTDQSLPVILRYRTLSKYNEYFRTRT